MAVTPFHPIVEEWFSRRFGQPTEAQRRGWPEIAAGRHTLIAAPTGSGKTLAAFLASIDALVRQAVDNTLADETQVLYVSPLKALSNDVRKNLEGPLAEIMQGRVLPPLRALVRTGDTPASERAQMLKRPPHILVTTPESLYLLLTSPSAREILRSVRTVIVDEIHALARDKRGSHLALSLERLRMLCHQPPTRVGLSATQKPIEQIAKFLVGNRQEDCRIIDTGHARQLDLGIETPKTPLGAVCSNEQWAEVDERLIELINAHRSTLIFVNTRRMAERVSHRLTEKLGDGAVASHHGSLSKELRLDAEERLKKGELKAIVATASLELGIDVGFIDLVVQLGSPRSIATFLQRVGRAGHHLHAVPKGRLFALTRDELLEALALLRAVKAGRLDAVEMPAAPLDILAQQLVAEAAGRDCSEDELYAMATAAWPYRDLPRAEFDRIVGMLSEGVARGRKDGHYLHRDALNKTVKARRNARLAAIMSGGAIPETADYRVVTEDDRTFVGTVNEDFAIESLAGDVFLLGNTSWRVRYVRGGEVVVSDAQGAPPSIPFWLGEAPSRTVELSGELSDLREAVARDGWEAVKEWGEPAKQAVEFVRAQQAAVGFVPTQKKILFERFFDDTGGMQLVIHSPWGARINRAWGLALRKSFCRTFDFELQASADDNGIVLSLGVQHSFPLEQMFKILKSDKAKDVLIQALLAAPMFQVRWRWNVTRSLAVLRSRGGKKVPPPLQRFRADDLLTAVFPQQTACFEHRPPDLPVPDHPLVRQTVHDCLTEAMDVERWEQLLGGIERGEIELVARDTREPSPFSHSILNANPYAFLDDAPLEERRARAVAVRRTLSVDELRDLARLDPEAIARVREEAWPLVRDEEELHDVLMSLGVLAPREEWRHLFERLAKAGRAFEEGGFWVAIERYTLAQAVYALPDKPIPDALRKPYERHEAVLELVRGWLEVSGPVSAEELAGTLELESVTTTLEALEGEGFAMRTDGRWCERRLLARIHRLTLEGARKRVQPVSPDVYWRFLSEYHHLTARREGRLGLFECVGQLQGFEAPATVWESELLPSRSAKYQPEWLDTLSFSGELTWGRLRPPTAAALTSVAPIALAFRAELKWVLRPEREQPELRPAAAAVHEALKKEGALFLEDLEDAARLSLPEVREALSELAALGLVTSDGFSALRALLMKTSRRARGGRWTLFPGRVAAIEPAARLDKWARQLLRRYGVLFRDLLTRETAAPSWHELVPVLRRMEARGEVRGGRFVAGVAGEQYALAEAVEALRRLRDGEDDWLVISAADPLNLAGIIDDGERVPALRGNRLLYHNGRVVATYQGGELKPENLDERMARALRLQIPSLRDGVLAELSEKKASGL